MNTQLRISTNYTKKSGMLMPRTAQNCICNFANICRQSCAAQNTFPHECPNVFAVTMVTWCAGRTPRGSSVQCDYDYVNAGEYSLMTTTTCSSANCDLLIVVSMGGSICLFILLYVMCYKHSFISLSYHYVSDSVSISSPVARELQSTFLGSYPFNIT